jgi:hypothetical protein
MNMQFWVFRSKRLLVLALVLAVVGPAYAVLSFTPGMVVPSAVPPLPSNFFMPLTLFPRAAANPDVIHSVELGRDDTSPYVAIVVSIGAGNPVLAAMGQYIPTFPPGTFTAIPGYQPPPPGTFMMRLVYRPTNDPASQGWVTAGAPPPPTPINPTQLDAAWQTCAQLAQQLVLFRIGAPAPGTLTGGGWIFIEFNPNGGTANALEFYKIQIVR